MRCSVLGNQQQGHWCLLKTRFSVFTEAGMALKMHCLQTTILQLGSEGGNGSVFEYGKCKLQVPHPCTVAASHPAWGLRLTSVAVVRGKELLCFSLKVRMPARLIRL